MKRLLFIALLFVAIAPSYCQNMYIDVKRNWYMQPPRMELDQLDTLVLCDVRPAENAEKPLLLWQYAGNDKYQPIIIYNPTPGMQFIYAMQRWKLEEVASNTYKLQMREGEKMFSGKLRKYDVIADRDDHLILHRLILVRKP